MKKVFVLYSLNILLCTFYCAAQNVGIGTTTPSAPLSVKATGVGISQESPDGFTRIGFYTANGTAYLQTHTNHDLNFATFNGAPQMVLKTNGNFGIGTTTPNATLSVNRSTGTDGTAAFFGSTHASHFNYSTAENTYIRAGKDNANVILNDIPGGKVGIGMSNPARAILEQYGSVGNTAAIFGGDGAGISLQKNWPAIGFNSWLDGTNHKSIAQGYGAQLGLNQTNGSLYLVSFPFAAVPNANFTSFMQRFYISRFGQIGLGTDAPQGDIHIIQTAADNTSGIRLEYTASGYPNPSSWNIFTSEGLFGPDLIANPLFFQCNQFVSAGAGIGNDGTYFQLSDRNCKKSILYLEQDNLLKKILLLKPASYLMKGEKDNGPLHYGFISQEVEKIFPEFILTTKENIKMLSYSSFIPVLTRGIQEQQQQIDELKQQVDELKKQVQLLLQK